MLAAMPCTDIAVTINQDLNKTENSHDHASHSDEADSCSPFCICNCCGVHIMSLKTVALFESLQMLAFSKTPISTYRAEFFSIFSNSIWQPPQLIA